MVQRVFRRPQLRDITGQSDSTIYTEMAAGCFPRPIPIGVRDVAWTESDMELLQAARIAERDGTLHALIHKRQADHGTVELWLLKLAERAEERRSKRRGKARVA